MYEEEGRGKAVREAMLARIPIGRLGEPDDFAGALVFLTSAASDFVTGQVLYVDGGYTAG
jgi:NAD(P)-dependent dehydrogenase (short-subunit alcohol dehydrogenase family)